MKSFLSLWFIIITGVCTFAQSSKALKSFNKGLPFYKNQQFDEALPFFKKAVWEDPEFEEAHRVLAKIYEEQAQLSTAIKHYKRVLAINSNQENVWLDISKAYAKSEHLDKARSSLEKALDLNPDYQEAKVELALISGQGDTMLNGISYFLMAEGLYESERYADALKLLDIQNSLQQEAKNYLLAAKCYAAQNDEENLNDSYQKVLLHEPNNEIALQALGDISYANIRYTEAFELYDAALKHGLKDSDLYFAHGKCAVLTNNPDAAVYSLQKAIEMDGPTATKKFYLAKAYEMTGDIQLSSKYMNEAEQLGLKPETLPVEELMAMNANKPKIMESTISDAGITPNNDQPVEEVAVEAELPEETVIINMNPVVEDPIVEEVVEISPLIESETSGEEIVETINKPAIGVEVVDPLGNEIVESIPEPVVEEIVEDVVEIIPEPVAEEIVEEVVETMPEPVVEEIVEDVVEIIPEPVVEEIVEEVVETMPEPVVEEVVEEIVEIIPEPVAEEIVEEVVETIPEPVVEEIVEEVVEAIPEPVAEEIVEEVVETIPEPVVEEIVEEVVETIPEPVVEEIVEEVVEAIPEPVAEEIVEEVVEAIPEPVVEEIEEEVVESIPALQYDEEVLVESDNTPFIEPIEEYEIENAEASIESTYKVNDGMQAVSESGQVLNEEMYTEMEITENNISNQDEVVSENINDIFTQVEETQITTETSTVVETPVEEVMNIVEEVQVEEQLVEVVKQEIQTEETIQEEITQPTAEIFEELPVEEETELEENFEDERPTVHPVQVEEEASFKASPRIPGILMPSPVDHVIEKINRSKKNKKRNN